MMKQMSLDVHLTVPGIKMKRSGSGIFVRENGQTKEVNWSEWYAAHPGRCYVQRYG